MYKSSLQSKKKALLTRISRVIELVEQSATDSKSEEAASHLLY